MTADGNPCRPVPHLDRMGQSIRCAKTGSEGFTLLEILVAMVLTAFGVLGFTGLLKVLGDAEAQDAWETKALFCAQERMEELKFACLTGITFTTDGGEIVADGAYRGMHRDWTAGDSPVFEGLVEIRVGCGYPWKGGIESVELSTLVWLEE